MKTNCYTLTTEPEAAVYYRLLDHALKHCKLAFVVIRPDMPLTAHGKDFIKELEPFIRNKAVAKEWPGTQLVDGTAEVNYFSYDEVSVKLLKSRSTRLFQWVQPDLPEDLGLLKIINEPWLVSISHENDGYFLLDDIELTDLVTHVPELQSMIRSTPVV